METHNFVSGGTEVNVFVHPTNNQADVGSSFGKCTANFRAEPTTVDFIVRTTREQTVREEWGKIPSKQLIYVRLPIENKRSNWTQQPTKFRSTVANLNGRFILQFSNLFDCTILSLGYFFIAIEHAINYYS